MVKRQSYNGKGDLVAAEELHVVERSRVHVPSAHDGEVTLQTFTGLGDVLETIAVGYAAAEAGLRPSLELWEVRDWPVAKQSVTEIDRLPSLPLLSYGGDGRDINLRFIGWTAEDTHDNACRRAGVTSISTPRYGMLLPPEGLDLRRLKLHPPYVVLCTEGNSAADEKRLSEEQVAAVVRICDAAGLELLTVGTSRAQGAVGGRDLRGETTLSELCGIVATALLVVSAETGVAHLASCYNVPCIVIAPEALCPHMNAYAPVGYLKATAASAVSTLAIERAMRNMLVAARQPWTMVGAGLTDCGVAETARVIGAASGVPVSTFEARDPDCWAVAEYIDGYAERGIRVDPKRTVLSAHTDRGVDYSQYPAVIWHSAAYQRTHVHDCRRSWYVPLPTHHLVEDRPLPSRPRRIFWHGHVHRRKGLRGLLDAFAELRAVVKDVELHLLVGAVHHDPEEWEWLQAQQVPGLSIWQKDYWTPDELHEELLAADIFVHAEPYDGEQSGASSSVLAYGRPVVVTKSSRHDEVRGWCETAEHGLSKTLLRVIQDRELYARLCARAAMGASYRVPWLLARQYHAIVIQAIYDELNLD